MSLSQLDDIAVQDALGITQLPPYKLFQDTALPSVTLTAGATDTKLVDFTPSFFEYNKHYQITWTTNFSAGAGTTGAVKWGISQNVLPYVAPLLSQESVGSFDCSTELTAITGNATLKTVSAVYLTETGGGFPPKITLFFESTTTNNNITVQVNEVAIIKLD